MVVAGLQNAFTGQPGDVPELHTIQQYDINDYKTKSELTQERLFTSLVIAIRAYAQIELLQWGQARLARILQASLALGKANNLQGFAQNLLRQLEVLLYGDGSASACQEQGQIAIAVHVAGTAPYVLAEEDLRFGDFFDFERDCEQIVKTCRF